MRVHDMLSMLKGNFTVIFVAEFLLCMSWKLSVIDLYGYSAKLLIFSSRTIRLNKNLLHNLKCVHLK
jgi:hypothetical protein